MEVPTIYIYKMEVPYTFRIYYNIISCMFTHQFVIVYLYKHKFINVIYRMLMITI